MASKSGSRISAGVVFAALVSTLGLAAVGTYLVKTPEATRVPQPLRRTAEEAPVRAERPARRTEPERTRPAPDGLSAARSALGTEGDLLRSVKRQGAVLRFDFDEKLTDGMGSEQESAFLDRLATLAKRERGVTGYAITVGGQPVDSLGHIEITDPMPLASAPPAP